MAAAANDQKTRRGRRSLGWRDPLFLASRPSGDRVRRFVAMLLMLQRLSYLLPSAVSLFAQKALFTEPGRNAVLLAVALVWNVTLFRWVARRGWFAPSAVVIDIVATCVFLIGITSACQPEWGTCVRNWSSHALLATGALVGAVSVRPIQFAALVPPIAVYAVAHAADLGHRFPFLLELAVRVNSAVWFAVITFFIRRYLEAQATRLDRLAEERLAAEAERVAERVAEQARLAHYRQLHDTVLATLTAISRGGLDHRTEEVRRRCASDAAYVRALISQDAAGPATGLGNGLARAVARAVGLGLTVRYAAEALPDDLPEEVAVAMAEAATEALNNVARHSGERDAWLTAVAVDGVVTVRTVDRGRGYDPDLVEPGYGVGSSMVGRMREVGGSAEVITAPGEGVCVELRWPDRPL
ncbi:sensor histidine kinase [Nonomuraea longicatena]|uniref:Histidine kinase/HSP90-like ATPase domain-containing protein n=1 Tax=Nonomuraea longicatena TaxID=83682 RepID=A0ABN1PAA3_9ACTN